MPVGEEESEMKQDCVKERQREYSSGRKAMWKQGKGKIKVAGKQS